MTIDEALGTITSSALDTVKKEFLDLYKTAVKDRLDVIKDTAKRVAQALIYRAQGVLDDDSVLTLLKKTKKLAQIEANDAAIAVLTRIHDLAYRILDIAIDILVKAIVPI